MVCQCTEEFAEMLYFLRNADPEQRLSAVVCQIVPPGNTDRKTGAIFVSSSFSCSWCFALRQPQSSMPPNPTLSLRVLVRSSEVFEFIRQGIDLVRFEHQAEPVFKSKSREYSAAPVVRQLSESHLQLPAGHSKLVESVYTSFASLGLVFYLPQRAHQTVCDE